MKIVKLGLALTLGLFLCTSNLCADIFGPTQDAVDIDISDAGGYYSGTDVETALQEVGAGGGTAAAPKTADYLVGTANGSLSAEIVVGTTPGGELGNTWASPTIDATHSGSAHHVAATITLPDANVTSGQGITFAQAGIMGITESAPDTVTFTATEVDGSITNELQNIFQTVATTSGTSPVADTTTDTLTLTAGTGMTITGDSATDTVTIATTALLAEVDGSITNELPIAGNLIDISGAPASTVDVDLTEAESVTWGAGAAATIVHTYNVSGTDTTMTMGSAATTFSGTLAASNLSGSNTGDNTVATSGDAALDFFGAGVTAVTDGTACTDIEGTSLTIAGGTLNVDDDFLLNNGDTGTGVYDFTGATIAGATPLIFEGATADEFETSFLITDPTTPDKVITFPNATGTVAVSVTTPLTLSATGGLAIPQATTSVDGYVVQADWDSWTDHVADNTQAHSDYFINTGDIAGAGVYDFGSANVVLEIPNAAAPTTDATGEMAIDTNLITQGMLQVYLTSAIANVVATTDTPGDNEVPTYDAAGGTVQWEAAGAGSGDITSVGDVADGAAFDGTQGTTLTFYDIGGNATLAYNGTTLTSSKFITSDLTGTVTGTASGNALPALSNLASVACNLGLVSDTANTDDLGTEAIYWKKLYLTSDISFEGATDDAYQTTLTAVDTTVADKSINIPNADGTMAVSASAPLSLSALGALTIDNISYAALADGTAGNLITWSAAGAPALVATGTATQVLTSNGAGTAPTFQAAAGGSVATDAIWDAAGDLVYGTGANTAARLAAGATTTILVGGGAAAPVWTTATGTGAPVRAGSPTFTTQISTPIIDLTGGQIAFPANQAASAGANTLDDYEEGTWTITPTNLTVVGTPTYTGTYTKIGRVVYITVWLASTTSTASTAGSTYFNLPFSSVGVGTFAVSSDNVVASGACANNGASTCFTPTWAANPHVYISGFFFIS